MTVCESTPLILFSGLAADAVFFGPQKLAFPHLIVPPWPVPARSDTLDSYSQHLADRLRPNGRVIIGGASFGGIIALHVAQYLDPLAVLLIGSVHEPAELPCYARLARPLRPCIRFIPMRTLQFCSRPFTTQLAQRLFPLQSVLAQEFRRFDPTVFKWSLSRILDWDEAPRVPCSVFHLHGDRDRIMPARYTHPDTIVKGGGHFISLTHPLQVNAFMSDVIARIEGNPDE